MSAADSSLKTAMYIGESQQRAATNFATSISGMFSAISEGQKFAGEVNRSMVQAALNYKQVEMDEFFKNEQLKIQGRNLALQEKEAENRIKIDNARLDLATKESEQRKKILAEHERDKAESEAYKGITGEIDAERIRYASEASVAETLAKKYDAQIIDIDRDVGEQIKLLTESKAPQSQIFAVRQAAEDRKRTLRTLQEQSFSRALELTPRADALSGLQALALNRSRKPEDLASQLSAYRESWKPAPAAPTPAPEYKVPTIGSLSVNVPFAPSTPTQRPAYVYGAKDLQSSLFARDFDPEHVRDVVLPDIFSYNKPLYDKYQTASVDYARKIFSLYANKDDYKHPLENPSTEGYAKFVDRWAQVTASDDDLSSSFSDRSAEIATAAKRAYQDWSSKKPDERLGGDDPREAMQKAADFYLNKSEPNLPPNPFRVAGEQKAFTAPVAQFTASPIFISEEDAIRDIASGRGNERIKAEEYRQFYSYRKSFYETAYKNDSPESRIDLSKKLRPIAIGLLMLENSFAAGGEVGFGRYKPPGFEVENKIKYLLANRDEAYKLLAEYDAKAHFQSPVGIATKVK
jgi:hypothetical protein